MSAVAARQLSPPLPERLVSGRLRPMETGDGLLARVRAREGACRSIKRRPWRTPRFVAAMGSSAFRRAPICTCGD